MEQMLYISIASFIVLFSLMAYVVYSWIKCMHESAD